MQLLIILALLLYGGNGNAGKIISEVKPVLESIGGEDMKQALKSAEEITEVLSVVQTMSGSGTQLGGFGQAEGENATVAPVFSYGGDGQSPAIGFPLSPISAIADRDITYSLSQYISNN